MTSLTTHSCHNLHLAMAAGVPCRTERGSILSLQGKVIELTATPPGAGRFHARGADQIERQAVADVP